MEVFCVVRRFFRSKRAIAAIFFTTLLAYQLVACNSYGLSEGVTFVAASGKPAVESIIWSPTDMDSVLIASSTTGHSDDQLAILNLTTRKSTLLQENMNGKLFALDWSPDGNHILFARTGESAEDNTTTSIIGIDGRDEKILMEWVPDAVWSPDGTTIAYFSYGKQIGVDLREINLHLMDVKTEVDTIISTFESNNSLGLSWSRDGQHLVFALGSLKASNLHVLNLVTGDALQITKDGLADSPAWSPYGDVIAYHKFSEDGLLSSLVLIRADGSCEVQIPNIEDAGSPTWLPDGRRLGFITLDGIYTLDLEQIFEGDIYQSGCPKLKQ